MSQLYFAFDSETGGLNETKADILTVYAAIMDEDHKILEEVYLKLKPNDGRLPVAEAGALAVNKINIQEHLADPETVEYREGKKRLVDMVRRHLKKRGKFSNISPYGYNVPFDKRWLQHHLIPQDEWESLFHYKDSDIMQNVDFLKRIGWFPKELGSLGTVVQFLGIPTRNAHNAKEDTLMTIDVDKKILEFMRSKKDNGGGGDIISLLESE